MQEEESPSQALQAAACSVRLDYNPHCSAGLLELQAGRGRRGRGRAPELAQQRMVMIWSTVGWEAAAVVGEQALSCSGT